MVVVRAAGSDAVTVGLAMALAFGRELDTLLVVAWLQPCSKIVETLSALHSSAVAWHPSVSCCST